MPLWDKIRTIAQKIYRADDITGDKRVQDQLADFEKNGMGSFPVCIAKTQYSFSADASLKGAPTGFTVPVREVRLSNGAGFIVVVCGDIMTMPGLPRFPAANSIGLNAEGMVEGLF
jgi:formate--tetrahydrofolate ligase